MSDSSRKDLLVWGKKVETRRKFIRNLELLDDGNSSQESSSGPPMKMMMKVMKLDSYGPPVSIPGQNRKPVWRSIIPHLDQVVNGPSSSDVYKDGIVTRRKHRENSGLDQQTQVVPATQTSNNQNTSVTNGNKLPTSDFLEKSNGNRTEFNFALYQGNQAASLRNTSKLEVEKKLMMTPDKPVNDHEAKLGFHHFLHGGYCRNGADSSQGHGPVISTVSRANDKDGITRDISVTSLSTIVAVPSGIEQPTGVANKRTFLKRKAVLSESNDDALLCPVCQLEYEITERVCVALPSCGHTFCRPCLQSVESRHAALHCPTCRKTHYGPSVHKIPVNYALLGVIDAHKSKVMKQDKNCGIHNSALEAWCRTCQKAVCIHCLLKEHRDSSYHDIGSLSEIVMELETQTVQGINAFVGQMELQQKAMARTLHDKLYDFLWGCKYVNTVHQLMMEAKTIPALCSNDRSAISSDSVQHVTMLKREEAHVQALLQESRELPVTDTKGRNWRKPSNFLSDSRHQLVCAIYTGQRKCAHLRYEGGHFYIYASMADQPDLKEQIEHVTVQVTILAPLISKNQPCVFVDFILEDNTMQRIVIQLDGTSVNHEDFVNLLHLFQGLTPFTMNSDSIIFDKHGHSEKFVILKSVAEELADEPEKKPDMMILNWFGVKASKLSEIQRDVLVAGTVVLPVGTGMQLVILATDAHDISSGSQIGTVVSGLDILQGIVNYKEKVKLHCVGVRIQTPEEMQ